PPGRPAAETYYDFFDRILPEGPEAYLAADRIHLDPGATGEGLRRLGPHSRPVGGDAGDGTLGLTFFGPYERATGLGQAARGHLAALEAAGVEYGAVSTGVPDFQARVPFEPRGGRLDWPVALAHVTWHEMPHFVRQQGRPFAAAEHRIGVWVWELPSLPPGAELQAVPLDEVWVPSAFNQRAVQAISDVPVYRIPYVVEPRPGAAGRGPEGRARARARFGLPEGAFAFLYMFDACSYVERKNPFALVRAFREEFAGRGDAVLVLKVSHGTYDTRFVERLGEELDGPVRDDVLVIDEVLPDEGVSDLIAACDCYVSPHRSEGFGLTLAEAMLEGKPVIGTRYGGVTDFLTDETGYPVDFRLVEIAEDLGVYRAGNVWADPSVPHLARRMREVFGDPEGAARRGARGRRFITDNYSRQAVGRLIAERLRTIYGV
ncbi:MAG TPA: glycosyltransferase, partial [Gemmataceae bacterium]|nr:glycosyltransferase [Gemmataceae bacterium]